MTHQPAVEVAIKFCGGCNPTYDRVEYWNRIQHSAGERIRWFSVHEQHGEVVLVISGCHRACPEKELQTTSRCISVKSDRMAPHDVVGRVLGKENSGEDHK